MVKIIALKLLKNDLRHYLVNSSLTLLVLVFYFKYGFFGWFHLLSVIFIHYSVLTLDDWLEKKRPFPYYVLPLVSFAAYYFPLITVLAMLGDVVANLRSLTGRNNFILERIEGLGNVFIYVIPFTLPVGLNNLKLYVAASFFILFADSFHKIGHREISNSKLMWLSGLTFFLLVSLIFGTPSFLFLTLLTAILLSLLPFKLIKNKFYSWAYSQIWFGFVGLIGFYYYLNFVV
ncbi:hypothetical protein COT75_03875 [Candidatus Beckwithbacteria bacterium CG10_big_fil_rev_8_21_14_0_10_34_10]|uniref:Uncharacterized protein n=1 Tax=Candidatus Beckwithbacteria bacterium CG10_big_fil_rev_8_21_14_0_10_34_10 TaxID=1974495 RepID=A0A2H0W8T3_9BACT|nr:MAG: hypothetical protein COT75_03875 [Candidatus Beckwithbacteria bacterium CG10_big_fil_rev_8_21_14_0_10_34_10]